MLRVRGLLGWRWDGEGEDGVEHPMSRHSVVGEPVCSCQKRRENPSCRAGRAWHEGEDCACVLV